MSFIDDFLPMMPSTVHVAPLIGRDTYGAATYGADVPYKAHIANKQVQVRAASGELVIAKGTVWTNCTIDVATTARLTMPDGSTPVLLAIDAAQDETGETQYTKFYLG